MYFRYLECKSGGNFIDPIDPIESNSQPTELSDSHAFSALQFSLPLFLIPQESINIVDLQRA